MAAFKNELCFLVQMMCRAKNDNQQVVRSVIKQDFFGKWYKLQPPPPNKREMFPKYNNRFGHAVEILEILKIKRQEGLSPTQGVKERQKVA